MRDRTVNVDPRRYELVPSGATGTHGGPTYDVYFASTPNVAGTPLKADVLLADAVALKYGLNTAKTNEALYLDTDFPHPSNAFRDVWKYIYPVGSIFQTINPNFATTSAVDNWFGGTWARWGEGKITVAYSSTDADFGTISATGGYKGIQQHTHSLNHNHSVASSSDLTSASNMDGLVTGSQSDHLHTTPAHTHTVDATTPGSTGSASVTHTHTYSDTTNSTGSHDHDIFYSGTYRSYASSLQSFYALDGGGSGSEGFCGNAGSHIHSFSGTTSGQSATHTHGSASHTHSITSSGGSNSGNAGAHSHAIASHTHVIASHAHTMAVGNFTTDINTSAAGANSTAINGNMPPYIVCYSYVRLT